jgi:hypothetical protein
MMRRLLTFSCLAIGAAALAVLGACGDPTRPDASFETAQDTLAAFAINGTPPGFPSGLSLVGGTAPSGLLGGGFPVLTRVDGSLNFDVAFDIDNAGNAVVYPLGSVASPIGSTRAVGLQRVSGTFESATEAPGGTYQVDSAFVALPGEVIVVEAPSPGYCGALGSFAQNVYAKLTVDSVRTADRTVFFRVMVDPNCGFRSLAPGRPRD